MQRAISKASPFRKHMLPPTWAKTLLEGKVGRYFQRQALTLRVVQLFPDNVLTVISAHTQTVASTGIITL
jgi:hypothetical protein